LTPSPKPNLLDCHLHAIDAEVEAPGTHFEFDSIFGNLWDFVKRIGTSTRKKRPRHRRFPRRKIFLMKDRTGIGFSDNRQPSSPSFSIVHD
jgi:hypothetical protein